MTAIIAEDDAVQQRLLETYCERRGIAVLASTASGKRLIEECLALRPDLIFLDIGLDKLDGISACQRILEASPGLRPQIVFVTGSLDPKHMLAGINELGSAAYITKPVTYPAFERAVDRAADNLRKERLALSRQSEPSAPVRWITVKLSKRELTVSEEAILYIEKVEKRRLRIALTSGETLNAVGTLKDILDQSSTLFSPHRAYLVNRIHVQAVAPDPYIPGNYSMKLRGTDWTIPLTRRQYSDYVAQKTIS